MTINFTRALGNEAGIQLNPLVDGSEIPATGNADQSLAMIMRATRGRIDKAFGVTSSNFYKRLGYGETIRANALNEAWVQAKEALDNGAYSLAVARLVGTDAKNNWMVAKLDSVETKGFIFSVSIANNLADYSIAVKHKECFNDGVILSIHADEKRENGVLAPNDMITLKMTDIKGAKLYEFTGSLTLGSKDDYGNSNYLPDIVESLTDNVEVLVSAGLSIAPDSTCYGFNDSGESKWDTSTLLDYFDEGTVGSYTTETYVTAREQLEKTQLEYRYIASGGSKAIGLLAELARLAHNTNRQLRFDIDGSLTPEQAIVFMESLNMGANKSSHLIHAYWTPLKTNDPSGVNGKSYIGTSGLNIGMACGRNAAKDSNGFAPKNFPIAGRMFPITRSGIVQTYTPTGPELSQLAAAKINPVVYESYEGVGLYVFRDSLTCAPVTNSLRKLIAVAEMASSVDDAVTGTAKMYLQLPINTAIKRMDDFMKKYLEGAESAEWLVPSDDPAMGGASFKYVVQKNAARPYDTMDIGYWVHYDGTARQMFVTQTVTK